MAAGGGIHSTVGATRSADDEDLLQQTHSRLESMLASGTTTVEVKSGYGLDLTNERRLLETVAELRRLLPMQIVATFLAHAIPPSRDRQDYVDEVIAEILPACADLATFCDVFCDVGAFESSEAARILEAGRQHGLRPRVHAEQLAHSGGAQLAAMVGAASADHLDHADEVDIAALRDARVVATLLPGVSLTMGTPPPPVQAILDAGVPVALATDCNPGTSYLTSMPLVVTLAVLDWRMTPEQALWAATCGGARALDVDAGTIRPGARADIVILDSDSPADLAYRPGRDLVAQVFVAGQPVSTVS